jgi:hypothetical protein
MATLTTAADPRAPTRCAASTSTRTPAPRSPRATSTATIADLADGAPYYAAGACVSFGPLTGDSDVKDGLELSPTASIDGDALRRR